MSLKYIVFYGGIRENISYNNEGISFSMQKRKIPLKKIIGKKAASSNSKTDISFSNLKSQFKKGLLKSMYMLDLLGFYFFPINKREWIFTPLLNYHQKQRKILALFFLFSPSILYLYPPNILFYFLSTFLLSHSLY